MCPSDDVDLQRIVSGLPVQWLMPSAVGGGATPATQAATPALSRQLSGLGTRVSGGGGMPQLLQRGIMPQQRGLVERVSGGVVKPQLQGGAGMQLQQGDAVHQLARRLVAEVVRQQLASVRRALGTSARGAGSSQNPEPKVIDYMGDTGLVKAVLTAARSAVQQLSSAAGGVGAGSQGSVLLAGPVAAMLQAAGAQLAQQQLALEGALMLPELLAAARSGEAEAAQAASTATMRAQLAASLRGGALTPTRATPQARLALPAMPPRANPSPMAQAANALLTQPVPTDAAAGGYASTASEDAEQHVIPLSAVKGGQTGQGRQKISGTESEAESVVSSRSTLGGGGVPRPRLY